MISMRTAKTQHVCRDRSSAEQAGSPDCQHKEKTSDVHQSNGALKRQPTESPI